MDYRHRKPHHRPVAPIDKRLRRKLRSGTVARTDVTSGSAIVDIILEGRFGDAGTVDTNFIITALGISRAGAARDAIDTGTVDARAIRSANDAVRHIGGNAASNWIADVVGTGVPVVTRRAAPEAIVDGIERRGTNFIRRGATRTGCARPIAGGADACASSRIESGIRTTIRHARAVAEHGRWRACRRRCSEFVDLGGYWSGRRHDDDAEVIVVSGRRSGKSTSCFLSTLLDSTSWPSSVVSPYSTTHGIAPDNSIVSFTPVPSRSICGVFASSVCRHPARVHATLPRLPQRPHQRRRLRHALPDVGTSPTRALAPIHRIVVRPCMRYLARQAGAPLPR